MLPVARAMGDFAFPGYDQLQYNFQFAYLDEALNGVFEAIDPEKNVFVISRGGEFALMTRILKSNHHRTLRFEGTYDLHYLNAEAVKDHSPKPERIYYIDLPNMGESARISDLQQLRTLYDVKEIRRFGPHGHFVEVYTMARRSS